MNQTLIFFLQIFVLYDNHFTIKLSIKNNNNNNNDIHGRDDRMNAQLIKILDRVTKKRERLHHFI